MAFHIVENLQKIDHDIQKSELKYHNKRVTISKSFTFDASHHLHCYEGKCKNLHGHTYRVTLTVSGYLNDLGLVIDFSELKAIWKSKIEIYLDHQYLNETLPNMNTTAENIVVWLYEQWQKALEARVRDQSDLRIESVRLYETSTSFAEVTRECMEDE